MATGDGGIDATTPGLRMKWFGRMLDSLPTGSLVDLGSGHGQFAIAAADRGWQVTAVDARGDRYPQDERIRWQVADIRETDLRAFDVVACLGLFYHLTVDDQLDLLDRCAGRPIILDTHVANRKRTPFALSEEVVQRGYHGQLFSEELQRSTASWGNESSFWPRPRALYRMLDEHGYDVMTAHPWYLPTRTFFLCLPR